MRDPHDNPEELAQADEERQLAALDRAIMEANAKEMQLQVKHYERTIKQRPVTYRCEWCSQESTEMRYPGPPPRYHPECKTEAQNALAAGRMRRLREQRSDPFFKPKRGRPKGS